MLKLYGFPVSNYFNMVKQALLEKEIKFELVVTIPDQSEQHLARSPIGKVPVIQTSHGYLSETNVILEYLEQSYPDTKPLMPGDLFEQAKIRELMQIIQLYLELPARRCFSEVFFGDKVAENTKNEVENDLKRGIGALKRAAVFSPFIGGTTFSLADIVFIHSIKLVTFVSNQLFKLDLLQDFNKASKLIEILSQRPHTIGILAEREAHLSAFIQKIKNQ